MSCATRTWRSSTSTTCAEGCSPANARSRCGREEVATVPEGAGSRPGASLGPVVALVARQSVLTHLVEQGLAGDAQALGRGGAAAAVLGKARDDHDPFQPFGGFGHRLRQAQAGK